MIPWNRENLDYLAPCKFLPVSDSFFTVFAAAKPVITHITKLFSVKGFLAVQYAKFEKAMAAGLTEWGGSVGFQESGIMFEFVD